MQDEFVKKKCNVLIKWNELKNGKSGTPSKPVLSDSPICTTFQEDTGKMIKYMSRHHHAKFYDLSTWLWFQITKQNSIK